MLWAKAADHSWKNAGPHISPWLTPANAFLPA